MNDKLGENPEIMAGVAMSLARERAALREKADQAEETSSKGGAITAIVVVVLLIGTLALMIAMNPA